MSSAHITALEITFNGWENARILFELVILWYNCGRQTKFNDKLSYARVFFLVFLPMIYIGRNIGQDGGRACAFRP